MLVDLNVAPEAVVPIVRAVRRRWTPIKAHPDLVTPMCQSDMVGTESGVVLVSTPYAETVRANMSVLASDDSGTSFHRQLRVWSGHCGYSALVCGLPGDLDCGVAFDRWCGRVRVSARV